MIIRDPEFAKTQISLMGYTRLVMYLNSRCVEREGDFMEGTTFENILNIHNFDDELRATCLLAVNRFEILLRNGISEALSGNFGIRPYDNRKIFNPGRHKGIIDMFHDKYRHTKNLLIREYKRDYHEADLPPIWFLKEALEFGDVIRLYQDMRAEICRPVANDFGVPAKGKFQPWIKGIKHLRNACAHHDRIFNHTFLEEIVPLKIGGGKTIPQKGVRPNKLAALLQCLDYMMEARGAPVGIEEAVRGLVEKYEEIDIEEIGF